MKKTIKIMGLGLVAAILFSSVSNVYALNKGTTNTGLDQIIEIINNDEGLKNRVDHKNAKKRVSQQDVAHGAKAANEMNKIIIKSIKATGIANDLELNTADARELNDYIYKNFHKEWMIHHGDDEKGVETGYHLVQNDGGNTIIYGQNALNTVFDGIYHLGFETSKKNRLLNEDGNGNQKFSSVAFWLNDLLKDDLKSGSLKNGNVIEIKGTTGTGLDEIVEYLKKDIGLNQRVKTSDMIAGAHAANEMNKILIEAMQKTGVTNDGNISEADVRELNLYIVNNHLDAWALHHGDDEKGEETGFHLVQNDGASKRMFGKNAVNTVFDGIYHLGFETKNKFRLQNEDGNNNAKFSDVAKWLDGLMGDDIKNNTSIQKKNFDGLDIVSGSWYMYDNHYKGVNLRGTSIALLKGIQLDGVQSVSTDTKVDNYGKYQNSFIIFDYKSKDEFKYAGARVGANYWTIGQYKNGKYKNLKSKKEKLQTNTTYKMDVKFTDKGVELYVDGVKKVSKNFTDTFTGNIGFNVEKSSTEFSKIKIDGKKVPIN